MCEERLTVVKNVDSESGPEIISGSHPIVSSSQVPDADLTAEDPMNTVTRKYYEVCSLRCCIVLNLSNKMPSLADSLLDY